MCVRLKAHERALIIYEIAQSQIFSNANLNFKIIIYDNPNPNTKTQENTQKITKKHTKNHKKTQEKTKTTQKKIHKI